LHFTRKDAISALRAAGCTDSDIHHLENVGTLSEIGAYDQYEQEVQKERDRARRSEKSIARKILRRHGRA